MKKYKMTVRGENFILKIEDNIGRHGFYATRYIEASNPESARNQVLDLIRTELRDSVRNEKVSPPKLYIEDVIEIATLADITGSGKGFTFYPEDEQQD